MTPFVPAGLMVCNSLYAIVMGKAVTIKHFSLWQRKTGFPAFVVARRKTATVKCSFEPELPPWTPRIPAVCA
ncbi:hypothetical protein ES703_63877 [subsurface metagenome]